MIIEISGTIDQEAFGKVIRACNELKPNEPIEIYLNSEGGDPDVGDAIVDLIAINGETSYTTLIAYGKVFSAAFDLYFKAQCNKRILTGTVGMAHLSRVEIDNFTVTDSKDNISALAYKKWWCEDKKSRLKFYDSIGLTKSELNKIKKGGDVYFQYNRLLELLNGKSN